MAQRLALAAVICLCAPALLRAQSPGTVKPAGKETTLTIGGLLQVQADFGDRGDSRFGTDNDRFYLRRARLNATGKFLEEFDFRIEGEFAGTLANSSGLRAQLTDAFINWNRYPEANIRMGQFKTPFGFEQLFSDPRLITIERSLVNDRLTLSRQLGVQVGGDLFEKRMNYAAGVFNGNGANNNFNDDDSFLSTARVSGVLLQGKPLTWSLGGNVFSSEDTSVAASDFGFDNNVFAGERLGTGFDTQLLAGRFELWAEYLAVDWEPSGRSEVGSEGWYVQGSYFFIPDRLQAVLKAESFDPVTEDRTEPVEIGTAGLSWYLKGHDLKLLLNYLRVQQDGQEDQDKILTRMQVIF
ncbi:MAG TPA: porin [Thermoanaerobaculia bacterium]|nr:porin [Thermoanaerobaculia bacterium]